MSTRPVLFQVVDTGLRPGLENRALDRAWLRTHARGSHIPVLRFHRSLPTASLGRFQAAGRELRLDVCARRGIEVARLWGIRWFETPRKNVKKRENPLCGVKL